MTALSYSEYAWTVWPKPFSARFTDGEPPPTCGVYVDNALVQRIFHGDAGTAARPYEFTSEDAAIKYLEKKLRTNSLVTDLRDSMPRPGEHNEILGRIKYHHLDPIKIMIFTDNPQARALAICRAHSLRQTLRLRHVFGNLPEICFYGNPGDATLQLYTTFNQTNDIESWQQSPELQPYYRIIKMFEEWPRRTYLEELPLKEKLLMAPILLNLGFYCQKRFLQHMRHHLGNPELIKHFNVHTWALCKNIGINIEGYLVTSTATRDAINPEEAHGLAEKVGPITAAHRSSYTSIYHYAIDSLNYYFTHGYFKHAKAIIDSLLQAFKTAQVTAGQLLEIFNKWDMFENCIKENNATAVSLLIQFLISTGNKQLQSTIINTRYNGCRTPLHIASGNGYIDTVKLLLSTPNIDIDQISWNDEMTALNFACKQGSFEIAQLLVERKASITADWQGYTPLHTACSSKSAATVELLLKTKAFDVNRRTVDTDDGPDETPLHIACRAGSLETVQLLIKHNANVNIRSIGGWQPLHLACCFQRGPEDIDNRKKIINCLVTAGAKVNQPNDDGVTPHAYAYNKRHHDYVALFLTFGARTY